MDNACESCKLPEVGVAIAKRNIRLALSDLGAVRARASELDFCDEEWQEYLAKLFDGQESLLREALEALQ